MKLYLIFSVARKSRGAEIDRPKELYQIFPNKDKAEQYKKYCEEQEPKLKFEIEEWDTRED